MPKTGEVCEQPATFWVGKITPATNFQIRLHLRCGVGAGSVHAKAKQTFLQEAYPWLPKPGATVIAGMLPCAMMRRR